MFYFLKIGRLGGGGTDFAAFVQHVGVPSVDIAFGEGTFFLLFFFLFLCFSFSFLSSLPTVVFRGEKLSHLLYSSLLKWAVMLSKMLPTIAFGTVNSPLNVLVFCTNCFLSAVCLNSTLSPSLYC